MADAKKQLTLQRAYTYAGKTYGPGPVNIDANVADALADREEAFTKKLADGYEPPAPVTPAATDGELVDPRRRPKPQPALTDAGGSTGPQSATSVRSPFQPPESDATDGEDGSSKSGASKRK